MRARIAWVCLAGALLAWPAAAAPHVSPKAVDCVWAAMPPTFKAALPGAADMDAFGALAKTWDPSDAELTKLAHACGVADTPKRAASATIGYAAAARAMEIWTRSRLAAAYQVQDADLTRLWDALDHADGAAMSRNYENGPATPLEASQANVQAAFAVIPPVDATEGRLIGAYIYARAQLDEIEAD
jgi:hypothetical protein